MTRLVSPALAISALLAISVASAEPVDPKTDLTPRAISELSLDDLFTKLKQNATNPAGERIEQEILRRFAQSGSPTADLLMSWAVEAMGDKNYSQALDVLDQIIVLRPEYAEAWNKRATVHFMMEDLGDSLADIRQTLVLQPRHFGALSGLGTILQAMDRKEDAIRVYRRALELDPRLDKVKESLDELEKETAGKGA
jgi:tetratricopeptide (TPR) repeat protein